MNCVICFDIIVDEAYARCEWCRIGRPVEDALEGRIHIPFGSYMPPRYVEPSLDFQIFEIKPRSRKLPITFSTMETIYYPHFGFKR